MYCLLRHVGNNYGILDTDDGAIDWMSEKELRGYVLDDKVAIQGVAPDMSKLVSQTVLLDASKCNWANGNNIFKTAKAFYVTLDGYFTLKADKKQFKGRVRRVDENTIRLEFNYGVHVVIYVKDFDILLSNKQDIVLPIIRSIC